MAKPKPKKMTNRDVPLYRAATKVRMETENIDRLRGIIGYEGGNGKCGLIYLNRKGEVVRMIMPNARVRVTGDRIDRSEVVRVPYALTGVDRWGYSDAIWDIPGRVDTFQGSPERYGSPEHVWPLLVMMAENELPDGNYHLVVTVPPGYYNQVREQVELGFTQGEMTTVNGRKQYTGRWAISLSKDGAAHVYGFPKVFVMMEAADAGYAAFRYDLNGQVVKKRGADGFDFLGGRTRFIDLGFGTCDVPTLINGVLLEDNLNRTSDAQGGIFANIAEPVMNMVIDQIPETKDWLTASHVDYWLRRYVNGWTDGEGRARKPWTAESGQVTVLSRTLHLQPVFEELGRSYASYAWRRVIEASQDQHDTALAIGGGWLYTYPDVLRKYQDAKLVMQFFSHEDVPHLKPFSFVDINLVGILILSLILVRDGVIA